MKQCKVCHETDQNKLVVYGAGHIRNLCRECKKLIQNQRYNENKRTLVDYKGGECEECAYNEYLAALCFHHVDPITKPPNWHRLCYWPIEKSKSEVDKCQLLCGNCHKVTHYGKEYEDMVPKYTRTTEPFLCKYCNEQDEDKMQLNYRTICTECYKKLGAQQKRKNKRLLVAHMGGCCDKCKLKYHQSVYEFHHLDPSKKDPKFKSLTKWSLERAKKELEGCIMVCSNCHGEIHTELRNKEKKKLKESKTIEVLEEVLI